MGRAWCVVVVLSDFTVMHVRPYMQPDIDRPALFHLPRYEKEGKFLTKKNTFLDFCACAEHLVKSGLTAPDRLAISGASAGGLLIGASVNMRPDLFKVALADVPFCDVVTTMCDASIPLTVVEWEEWGAFKLTTPAACCISVCSIYSVDLMLTGLGSSVPYIHTYTHRTRQPERGQVLRVHAQLLPRLQRQGAGLPRHPRARGAQW